MIELDIQKTTLNNDVRILSARMPFKRTVSLGVWVEVGARDEAPHESGFAHFIEHMVFKGTSRRTAMDIAREFDALGGQANAFTSMEHTCFHGRCLDVKLPQLADVLFDMVLNPTFDQTEIRRERPVVLQEIGMVEDDPEDYLHYMANRNFWQGTSLANSILGNRTSVRKFNRDKLTEYFRHCYHGARVIVAAAGNLEHNQLVDLTRPFFDRLDKNGALPQHEHPQSTSHHKVIARETEQVNIYCAMPGRSITSPDRFALGILNAILGSNMSSRLYQEIREKHGLAYNVYSFLSSFRDTGMLSIDLGVAPKDVRKALDLVMLELDRLCQDGITTQELETALNFLQSDLYLAAESGDSQMSRLAQTEVHFGRYIPLEETLAAFEAVTLETVRKIAREIFAPAKIGITILGPRQHK